MERPSGENSACVQTAAGCVFGPVSVATQNAEDLDSDKRHNRTSPSSAAVRQWPSPAGENSA